MKLIMILLLPCFAQACFVPKPEQTVSPEELVKRTKNIYIAEAESSRPLRNERYAFTFKVIETLKGHAVEVIHLNGLRQNRVNDFEAHTNKTFSNAAAGSALILPDCSIAPKFKVGERYLIFADRPYHKKSFEPILSNDDAWVKEVRELVTK